MAHGIIMQSLLVPFLMTAQDEPGVADEYFPYGIEQSEDATAPSPDEESERVFRPDLDTDPFPPTPMGDDLDLPRDDDVGPDFPLPEDVPLDAGEGDGEDVFQPEGELDRGGTPPPFPPPDIGPEL